MRDLEVVAIVTVVVTTIVSWSLLFASQTDQEKPMSQADTVDVTPRCREVARYELAHEQRDSILISLICEEEEEV